MSPPERTDYAALRQHLDAGRPWLDPMAWTLVDDAEGECAVLRRALEEACGDAWTDGDAAVEQYLSRARKHVAALPND
jgi:hypothetical protein